MSENGKEQETGNGPIQPVVTLFRVIWSFLVVITLMPLMLVNTLLHDTPIKDRDIGIGNRADDSSRA